MNIEEFGVFLKFLEFRISVCQFSEGKVKELLFPNPRSKIKLKTMGKKTLDNWDGVTNRANTLVQNKEVPARAHQTSS